MNPTEYLAPPVLLRNLMKQTFGDSFTYFLGSPTMIAEAAYPCCIIQPITSNNTVQNAPTGQDAVAEQINIHFLVASKDDLGASDEVDTSMWRLYQLVQGRDPQSGYYKRGTALHALRTNITLQNPTTGRATVLDQDADVNYDVTPRQGMPTILEAIVTVITRERVDIPDRV